MVGGITKARAQLDQAIALYDPTDHLATRFGEGSEDPRVVCLCWRSKALWLLGYPEAALADIDQALKDARESGHAASLFFALTNSFFIVDSYCGITLQQMRE
jgi:predicted ATPase